MSTNVTRLHARRTAQAAAPATGLALDVALNRVIKARTDLLLDAPFFGTLALKLKLVEDPSCKTMWVDGVSLGYNPAFVAECTHEHLKGVVCHEVLHVSNGHCWRMRGREHKAWNKAADLAINPIVLESGFLLPARALLNPDYAGMPAEQIYHLIHQPSPPQSPPPPQPSPSPGAGPPSPDGQPPPEEKPEATDSAAAGQPEPSKDEDGQPAPGDQDPSDAASPDAGEEGSDGEPGDEPGTEPGQPAAGSADGQPGENGSESAAGNGKPSPEEGEPAKDSSEPGTEDADLPGEVRPLPQGVDRAEAEADWKIAVSQAVNVARMRGKLSSSIERLVPEMLKPAVDWKDYLREFYERSHQAQDYQWRLPASRYVAQGLYLPRLMSESMPPIVVFTDTSASVYPSLLAAFRAEIEALVEESKPEEVFLGYADAGVGRVDRFDQGEPLEFRMVGGGGTDFRPAFRWVEEQQIEPACLIYFTDLDGDFPATAPDYPVLWVSPPTNQTVPWGELVEMRE